MKHIKSYAQQQLDKWQRIDDAMSTLVEDFGFTKIIDIVYSHTLVEGRIEFTKDLYDELVSIRKRLRGENKQVFVFIEHQYESIGVLNYFKKYTDLSSAYSSLPSNIEEKLYSNVETYYSLNELIEADELTRLFGSNVDIELVIVQS